MVRIPASHWAALVLDALQGLDIAHTSHAHGYLLPFQLGYPTHQIETRMRHLGHFDGMDQWHVEGRVLRALKLLESEGKVEAKVEGKKARRRYTWRLVPTERELVLHDWARSKGLEPGEYYIDARGGIHIDPDAIVPRSNHDE